MEITDLAFKEEELKQVRLLLYTEDIHDLHVRRRSLLRGCIGRQSADDVFTYNFFAPGSDERMIKITSFSMDVVTSRTQDVLVVLPFQPARPRHRHYIPNRLTEREYREVRWGGYKPQEKDSVLDATVATPRYRMLTHRQTEEPFRLPIHPARTAKEAGASTSGKSTQ